MNNNIDKKFDMKNLEDKDLEQVLGGNDKSIKGPGYFVMCVSRNHRECFCETLKEAIAKKAEFTREKHVCSRCNDTRWTIKSF